MADLVKLYIKKFVGKVDTGSIAFDTVANKRCLVTCGVMYKPDYVWVVYSNYVFADREMVLKKDLIHIGLTIRGVCVMKLVYKATGKEVKVGDPVVLKPDEALAIVKYFRKPHKPSSEGHVTVEFSTGTQREFYAGVIGARWIEREDQGYDRIIST